MQSTPTPPAAATQNPTPTPTPAPNYDTPGYRATAGAVAMNALAAYQKGATGKNVALGILDSGIDTQNPLFAGRISASSSDIAGTRGLMDESGHGTAVAFTAAGGRDGTRARGVAFDATLVVLRADRPNSCGAEGGCAYPLDLVTKGVDAARTAQARVLNISLSSNETLPAAMKTAIGRATAAGMIIVIAAGNDSESDPSLLAQIANDPNVARGQVIIAGSVAQSGAISAFSNRAGQSAAHFPPRWANRSRPRCHRRAQAVVGHLLGRAADHRRGGAVDPSLSQSVGCAGRRPVATHRTRYRGGGDRCRLWPGNARPDRGLPAGRRHERGGGRRARVDDDQYKAVRRHGRCDGQGPAPGRAGQLCARLCPRPVRHRRPDRPRPILATTLLGQIDGKTLSDGTRTIGLTSAIVQPGEARLRAIVPSDPAPQTRRIVAGTMTQAVSPRTMVGFGFASSGEALVAGWTGQAGPAFLTSDPGFGFDRAPQASAALRQWLGGVGVSVAMESGRFPAAVAPGMEAPAYDQMAVTVDRRVGRIATSLTASRRPSGRRCWAAGSARRWASRARRVGSPRLPHAGRTMAAGRWAGGGGAAGRWPMAQWAAGRSPARAGRSRRARPGYSAATGSICASPSRCA
nr:S8 family serine peptidase [Sphingomonas paucimobilis]